MISFLASIAIFAFGYFYGVLSHRYELPPYYYVKGLVERAPFIRLWRLGGYNVTTDRVAVECGSIPKRSLVMITFGQSNAANSGTERFGSSPHVYNLDPLDGRCYEARDPLLGASGDGGSPWIPLSQMLIDHGLVDGVVIAPIAVSGSRVADWAPGGSLAPRITRALDALANAGFEPHVLLWHQGEADRGTDPGAYTQSFLRMVAALVSLGVEAPIYVAQATRCGQADDPLIREAQLSLIDRDPHLRAGPNTDLIVGPDVREGCHLTRLGTLAHSQLWFETLKPDVVGLVLASRTQAG